MNKKFRIPELEIVLFAKEDIIVTSANGDNPEPYPDPSEEEM